MILSTKAILVELKPLNQWQPATWDDYFKYRAVETAICTEVCAARKLR